MPQNVLIFNSGTQFSQLQNIEVVLNDLPDPLYSRGTSFLPFTYKVDV